MDGQTAAITRGAGRLCSRDAPDGVPWKRQQSDRGVDPRRGFVSGPPPLTPSGRSTNPQPRSNARTPAALATSLP
jgi:hypothetical protein